MASKEECNMLAVALLVILQEARFNIPYTEYSDNTVACEMAKRLFSIEAEAKEALSMVRAFAVESDAVSAKEDIIKKIESRYFGREEE